MRVSLHIRAHNPFNMNRVPYWSKNIVVVRLDGVSYFRGEAVSQTPAGAGIYDHPSRASFLLGPVPTSRCLSQFLQMLQLLIPFLYIFYRYILFQKLPGRFCSKFLQYGAQIGGQKVRQFEIVRIWALGEGHVALGVQFEKRKRRGQRLHTINSMFGDLHILTYYGGRICFHYCRICLKLRGGFGVAGLG